MLFCPITSHTSALEPATSDQITVSPDRPKPTLSVSLAPNTELDITPSTKGTFASSSTKLSVATTNSSGYNIYIAAISKDQDTATDYTSAATMTNLDPTVKGAIVSLPDEMQFLPKDFPMNSWGLALSEEPLDESSQYQGIKNQPDDGASSLEPFLSVLEDDASHTYNLGLGAMMDASLPAGTYTADLLVSVVAEPAKLTGLLSIDYMQDMTPEVCNATYLHETKQLVDIRDNKTYWVAKLKDGNCWMTQNLALDLDPSRPLTPETSDVITAWRPKSKTESFAEGWGVTNLSTTFSWNLGNYVTAIPAVSEECQKLSDMIMNDEELTLGESVYALCSNFQEVSGWNPTYETRAGVWNGKSYNAVTVDVTSQSYDAHYLVGNFYQANTATAESMQGLRDFATAPSSICPKGWRLPLGGVANKGTTKSFGHLYNAYGMLEDSGKINFEGGEYNLALNPLYFNRTGFIFPDQSVPLDVPGRAGYYATASVDTGPDEVGMIGRISRSYEYNFNNIGLGIELWSGLSVRCVARD